MTVRNRSILKDEEGVVAILFAVMAVPMIGMVGLAVDYSHVTTVMNTMQTAVDDSALAAAWAGPDNHSPRWVNQAEAVMSNNFSRSDWLDTVQTNGRWLNGNDYEMTMTASVDLFFAQILPGVPDAWQVGVRVVAQLTEPQYIYQEPDVLDLDYEAGDYNRIYAYCYNKTTDTRSQEIAIADNGGTSYSFTMPICEAGEALSYRLYNVRMMRTTPDRWDDATAQHYNHYSDTVIVNDLETYNFAWDILETVLCDNLDECKPKSQGGIIPEGRDRIPQHNTTPCSAGKYMYYGWEDRPPGLGWTDRDYDDIRVIVGCPEVIVDGEKRVRLTQ